MTPNTPSSDNKLLSKAVVVIAALYGLSYVWSHWSSRVATLIPRATVVVATATPSVPFPRTPQESAFDLAQHAGDVNKIVTYGPVRVSFDAKTSETFSTATLLTIKRSGKEIYSNADGTQQVVAIGFLPRTSVSSAVVYITTFSGGAHCCFAVLAVDVDPNEAGYHDSSVLDLGNLEPVWKQPKVGGAYLLVGGDNDIAYRFGPYSDARFPIVLWQLIGRHFKNVTSDYPNYVAEDATKHYDVWLKYHDKTALVAQVADLLTLHRSTEASAAFEILRGDQMQPQMRQWLVARGYGDPVPAKSYVAAESAPLPSTHDSNGSAAETPVNDSDCSKESIETVSEEGAFVRILGGGGYIIDDVDRVDSQLWLATDDIVVCDPGPGGDVKFVHDGEIAHGHHARD